MSMLLLHADDLSFIYGQIVFNYYNILLQLSWTTELRKDVELRPTLL